MGVPTGPCDYFLKENVPIEREILSMFELGRKPFQVILVVFLDRKYQQSQWISVPTDRQTLSLHRYLLIESHRRPVGTPLYEAIRWSELGNRNDASYSGNTCPCAIKGYRCARNPLKSLIMALDQYNVSDISCAMGKFCCRLITSHSGYTDFRCISIIFRSFVVYVMSVIIFGTTTSEFSMITSSHSGYTIYMWSILI